MALPAEEAVRLIADSYHDLESGFAEITARAPDRFERREWHLLVADVLERLSLMAVVVPLGPDDVFPSEFRSFLGLSPDLLGVFLEHHSHLLEASWWKRVQTRIAGGDIVSIYPYSADLRL